MNQRGTNLGDNLNLGRNISPAGRSGSRAGSRAGSPSGRLTNILDPRSRTSAGRFSRGPSARGTMISRAGQGEKDPFAAPGDATNVALNSPDNIEKERDFERIYKILKKEFEKIDTNRDGTLHEHELTEFLLAKMKQQQPSLNIDEMRDDIAELANKLFTDMDPDNDGQVRLDEFVEFYYLEQRRLMESIEETKLRISDSQTRAE